MWDFLVVAVWIMPFTANDAAETRPLRGDALIPRTIGATEGLFITWPGVAKKPAISLLQSLRPSAI
ncbi:MAG: hypothetical protein EOR30_16215 [Mesorhizobium sp.]|uniref:hypothetical protein n=1 Tax=unclassified Mesorhizobium TaxID=325217 RepID=UPI000FCA21DE|nr:MULTISPECIES: hypothetical protein [unclassified Mesorhizobium]RUV74572.1 hypothetical protein EOA78_09005 [Mesorhizobium sp. M5C.F.Cr.IN.023.01.1.1]RWF87781.1 MAG: hypothetical protein EOQ36_10890 [Mesorhizobium sp.]RWF92309.1 MAG: hypothetical protein EOQ45_22090 [Mesorhizobium sp.]RWI35227.1 MAG: hypothetical protein EOR14_29755 [Mesorhizobium sp.]RWI44189.1 MAG: hypothetical protein EOR15_28055 [Mesorhizobium sp.]